MCGKRVFVNHSRKDGQAHTRSLSALVGTHTGCAKTINRLKLSHTSHGSCAYLPQPSESICGITLGHNRVLYPYLRITNTTEMGTMKINTRTQIMRQKRVHGMFTWKNPKRKKPRESSKSNYHYVKITSSTKAPTSCSLPLPGNSYNRDSTRSLSLCHTLYSSYTNNSIQQITTTHTITFCPRSYLC